MQHLAGLLRDTSAGKPVLIFLKGDARSRLPAIQTGNPEASAFHTVPKTFDLGEESGTFGVVLFA